MNEVDLHLIRFSHFPTFKPILMMKPLYDETCMYSHYIENLQTNWIESDIEENLDCVNRRFFSKFNPPLCWLCISPNIRY